ncbi:MAG: 2-amino-4-hydroxy-6-hydroxymethyldihydropteridine diphosphokinase [Gammaproteobacteria bacterium]|nr:2-amino-4-hydroxy-6-hydroxymethyldihydropteridine diphosphokinase [Gammaproteobacteria bacterium]
MTHVVLSLGSNLHRETNIRFAVEKIRQQFGVIEISPVYEAASVGFQGPSFLNLVTGFQCHHPLPELHTGLREIETACGRIRGRKSFDNRVLDIDVLLFGDRDMRADGYNIPRDEIGKYAYVLKPLADLYPDLCHPVSGLTYRQMWRDFNRAGQQLVPVDFALQ